MRLFIFTKFHKTHVYFTLDYLFCPKAPDFQIYEPWRHWPEWHYSHSAAITADESREMSQIAMKTRSLNKFDENLWKWHSTIIRVLRIDCLYNRTCSNARLRNLEQE